MGESLKSLRNQKYIGTVELADEAARLVNRFVPKQDRGSVSEVPDERMVRYYISEGLISPPEGKQGASSVYSYLHLLQLLAVKRLQAEHLPIKKIKELVEGKSESELERLLGIEERGRERSKNPALEYLESLLKPSKSRAPQTRSAPPAVSSPLSPYGAAVGAWARIEIEPGLEVHIREDYRLTSDIKERQRLARAILSEIEKHSQG